MFMDVQVRELDPGRVIYDHDWGYVVIDAITTKRDGEIELTVSAFDMRPETPRRPRGTIFCEPTKYVFTDYGRYAMDRGE